VHDEQGGLRYAGRWAPVLTRPSSSCSQLYSSHSHSSRRRLPAHSHQREPTTSSRRSSARSTRAGQRLDSPALITDGNHARADAYVSLAVVLSATLVALGFPLADPIVGLAIAVVIMRITGQSCSRFAEHAHPIDGRSRVYSRRPSSPTSCCPVPPGVVAVPAAASGRSSARGVLIPCAPHDTVLTRLTWAAGLHSLPDGLWRQRLRATGPPAPGVPPSVSGGAISA
jgi:cation efflux family protein